MKRQHKKVLTGLVIVLSAAAFLARRTLWQPRFRVAATPPAAAGPDPCCPATETTEAAAQQAPASSPGYQALDADLSALRQQFNQDAGQVRILMLLSPT